MATHRAAFSVTCGTDGLFGAGYADVSLKLPSVLSRAAQLVSVTVDVSDAVINTVPAVCISELVNVDDDTDNDGVETVRLGNQLFYVELANTGAVSSVGYPLQDEVYHLSARRGIVTMNGIVPPVDAYTGLAIIRTKKVRCEVFGGAADVYTVHMYYETSGDYRF